MDRSERLSREESDAGQILIHELTQSYPLAAAFWFKYADEDRWHLDATFQSMTRDEFDYAFALVRRSLSARRDDVIDPFEMTFFDAQKALVQRTMELTDEVLITTSHWRLPMTQGASVEAVVIYPRRDLIWTNPVASEVRQAEVNQRREFTGGSASLRCCGRSSSDGQDQDWAGRWRRPWSAWIAERNSSVGTR